MAATPTVEELIRRVDVLTRQLSELGGAKTPGATIDRIMRLAKMETAEASSEAARQHQVRKMQMGWERKDAEKAMEEATKIRKADRAYGYGKAMARFGPDHPMVEAAIGELREADPLLASRLKASADSQLLNNIKKIERVHEKAGVALQPEDIEAIRPRVSIAMREEGGIKRLLASEQVAAKQAAREASATEAAAALEKAPKKGGLKRAGLWGAGGLAAFLLASKMFSGKDEGGPRLPPEMQMALAAQLQNQQGVNTSQTLRDMSKMLGIIKMLQDIQGMQPQQPSMARIM